MYNIQPGSFIVFEGVDGCGSTTQSKNLARELKSRGFKAKWTCEPTDNHFGGLSRALIDRKIKWHPDPFALQLLFTTDRQQHVADVIEPNKQHGIITCCDRYCLSTFVYGALTIGDGTANTTLRAINSLFPKPDITFYIRVTAETALYRQGLRGKDKSIFEKIRFTERLVELYNYMCTQVDHNLHNVVTIEGDMTESAVFEKVLNHLQIEKRSRQ